MNPIVLLHGALGAEQQLKPIAEALQKHTKRPIYTYNFPGHGGTDVPQSGFDMGVLAREFGAWLSSMNLMGADIFGYSMGGYIALLTVRSHPERIRHILTLGTKFDWSPEGAQREVRHLDAQKLEEKVPAYAHHLQQLHGPKWKEVLKATASMMLKLGENPLLNDTTLQSIQHPVIITRGTEDRMVTREESESVSLTLPDARYKEIEGWVHPLEKLDIEALSVKIIGFLG